MITNSDITIYNRIYDPATRLETWKRTVIKDVNFYVDKRVTQKDGQDAASVYKVRIPEESPDAMYVPSGQYNGTENTWTLRNGDYVVQGIREQEIQKPSDLVGEHVFCITSWADNRRGDLQHWRIGGE